MDCNPLILIKNWLILIRFWHCPLIEAWFWLLKSELLYNHHPNFLEGIGHLFIAISQARVSVAITEVDPTQIYLIKMSLKIEINSWKKFSRHQNLSRTNNGCSRPLNCCGALHKVTLCWVIKETENEVFLYLFLLLFVAVHYHHILLW